MYLVRKRLQFLCFKLPRSLRSGGKNQTSIQALAKYFTNSIVWAKARKRKNIITPRAKATGQWTCELTT